MTGEFDALYTLAVLAVGLNGFAAVVMARTPGTPAPAEIDRYHGVLAHGFLALGACFLPALINVIVQDPVTTLHLACAALGIATVVQATIEGIRVTSMWVRVSLVVGVIVGLLQFTAFSDWGVHREFDLYAAGILWHLLHAALLFLLWVRVHSE